MLMFIVVLIFAIFMLIGYKRGLFRSILKLVLTGLSFVLAYFLAPLVGGLIIQYTNIDENLQDRIYAVIQSKVEERVSAEVENAMAGVDTSIINQMTAAMTQAVMATEPDRNTQISIIQSSGFPSYIKDALVANNNDETKGELGVYGFYDYMATYVAYMIINSVAFFITIIILRVLLGLLSICLSFVVELPIVGSINRMGGILFGAVEGLIIVWLFMLIVSFFSDGGTGKVIFDEIYSNRFLTLLYERNLFVKAVEEIIAIIK